MTRSDIVLNQVRMAEGLMTEGEKLDFVYALHNKIEGVYQIVFAMEKDSHIAIVGLAKLLRDTLEK